MADVHDETWSASQSAERRLIAPLLMHGFTVVGLTGTSMQ
jgi:hypothetical protein